MAGMLYMIADYFRIVTCGCIKDDNPDTSIMYHTQGCEKFSWTCCALAMTPCVCVCVIALGPCCCGLYVCGHCSDKIINHACNDKLPPTVVDVSVELPPTQITVVE